MNGEVMTPERFGNPCLKYKVRVNVISASYPFIWDTTCLRLSFAAGLLSETYDFHR